MTNKNKIKKSPKRILYTTQHTHTQRERETQRQKERERENGENLTNNDKMEQKMHGSWVCRRGNIKI